VLDLFSGIGGFSLGLERAGMKTVAFCEIEPFCRAVLKKHWPSVPQFDDVRRLRGEDVGPVDLVCGGFPCQPFSTASRGRRLGTEDDRYLWPEMLRVISETRPSWVIGENVIGLKPVEVEQVVSDLGAQDFNTVVMEIPACATLKDHWRPRNWFLGYSDRNGKSKRPVNAEMAVVQRRNNGARDARGPHGFSKGLDGLRKRALGNAVVPQVVEIIGRAIMQTAHPNHEGAA
jgi:DNA (cytosine-5)-methyltransferase 1